MKDTGTYKAIYAHCIVCGQPKGGAAWSMGISHDECVKHLAKNGGLHKERRRRKVRNYDERYIDYLRESGNERKT